MPNYSKLSTIAPEDGVVVDGGAKFVDKETLNVSEHELVRTSDPDIVMRYDSQNNYFLNPLDRNCYNQEDVRENGGFMMASMPGQLSFAIRWVHGLGYLALFIMAWIVYGADKCDTKVRYTQNYLQQVGSVDDDELSPLELDGDNSTEQISIPLTWAGFFTIIVGIYALTAAVHALMAWGKQSDLKREPLLADGDETYEHLAKLDYFSGFFYVLWKSFSTQIWRHDIHIFTHITSTILISTTTFLLVFVLGSQDLYFAMTAMALALAAEMSGFAMNYANAIREDATTNTDVRRIRWAPYFVRVFAFAVVGTFLTIWMCRYPDGQRRAYMVATFCVYMIVWGLMVVYQFFYYVSRDMDVLEWAFEMYKEYEEYRLGTKPVSSLGLFPWIMYLFYVATHSWTFVSFYKRVQGFIYEAKRPGRERPDVVNVYELAEFSRMHPSPFWYETIHLILDLALAAVACNLLIWPICDDNFAPIWN